MWRCEDCELTICDTNITNSVDRQQISAPKTGQTRTTLLLIAIPAGQRGMSRRCRLPSADTGTVEEVEFSGANVPLTGPRWSARGFYSPQCFILQVNVPFVCGTNLMPP